MATWGILPIFKEWTEEEPLVETEKEISEVLQKTKINYYQINQRRRKFQEGESK